MILGRKMKKSFITLMFSAAMIAGSIFSGCKTPDQKIDSAAANVTDAKQELKIAENNANEAAQIKANAEEWQAYKTECELKIRDNEIKINEIKIKMNKPGKILDPIYAKRIELLEQRNRNLKIKMDNYDKNPSNWASFKIEFKHDMDELGQAIKDLTVNNTK